MSGPAKASPGGMSGLVLTCLDLSGPVQEDKYLLQTSGNTFLFQKLHLSFFLGRFIIFQAKCIIFSPQPRWIGAKESPTARVCHRSIGRPIIHQFND